MALGAFIVGTPATAQTKPRPLTAPDNWFSEIDYPETALQERREGQASFELQIGPSGNVKACTINRSSGTAELDLATCSIIRERARFAPARDARGEAVASTYFSAIRWSLPSHGRTPPPEGETEIIMTIEPDGRVIDCTLLKGNTLLYPWMYAMCRPGERFTIPQGAEPPVTRRIRITSSVTHMEGD